MRPRVIFFDAVGTLLRVRGSVGQAYSQVAAEYGVGVDPQALDRAFAQAFASAPPPACGGLSGSSLLAWERAWWQQVVRQTFAGVGSLAAFGEERFAAFFAHLFEYFAGADPWELYPETLPVLQALQGEGIRLGVISNFDSRLPRVLQALGLEGYFSSLTLSTQVGYAKPDPRIFQAALETQGIPPEAACHIGDSYREDYQGATAAGLRALWLDREGKDPSCQGRIGDLWGALSILNDSAEEQKPHRA
ncbi:HAD-IA family hydrolase [Synechococcus sp. H70.1]|uniref:HAD-IA family hydrolase n=1 Tax=Synechococcus sp. H70.1 TaxID=2964527 RepID=UPI0039C68E08